MAMTVNAARAPATAARLLTELGTLTDPDRTNNAASPASAPKAIIPHAIETTTKT
jgi:hypothetical protein